MLSKFGQSSPTSAKCWPNSAQTSAKGWPTSGFFKIWQKYQFRKQLWGIVFCPFRGSPGSPGISFPGVRRATVRRLPGGCVIPAFIGLCKGADITRQRVHTGHVTLAALHRGQALRPCTSARKPTPGVTPAGGPGIDVKCSTMPARHVRGGSDLVGRPMIMTQGSARGVVKRGRRAPSYDDPRGVVERGRRKGSRSRRATNKRARDAGCGDGSLAAPQELLVALLTDPPAEPATARARRSPPHYKTATLREAPHAKTRRDAQPRPTSRCKRSSAKTSKAPRGRAKAQKAPRSFATPRHAPRGSSRHCEAQRILARPRGAPSCARPCKVPASPAKLHEAMRGSVRSRTRLREAP